MLRSIGARLLAALLILVCVSPVWGAERIRLTSDLVINVPLPGDPGNGSVAAPYSIQPAWDKLFRDYDLQGYDVTLQLQYGSPGITLFYKGLNISGRVPGQAGAAIHFKVGVGVPDFILGAQKGRITLRGNPADPFAAFIYDQNSTGAALSMTEGAALTVDGVGMATTTQDCVDVFYNAILALKNILFSNCGRISGTDPNYAYGNQISVAMGGFVMIQGKITVPGWGASFANVGSWGTLMWDTNGDFGIPIPFEILGTPWWPKGFLLVTDAGSAFPFGVQFIGAARGPRFSVVRNGVIETATGNQNYLPGDAPGVVASGGQYH